MNEVLSKALKFAKLYRFCVNMNVLIKLS